MVRYNNEKTKCSLRGVGVPGTDAKARPRKLLVVTS